MLYTYITRRLERNTKLTRNVKLNQILTEIQNCDNNSTKINISSMKLKKVANSSNLPMRFWCSRRGNNGLQFKINFRFSRRYCVDKYTLLANAQILLFSHSARSYN